MTVPARAAQHAPAGAGPPVLTFCDDATGERTDLTADELGRWSARAARLLHEGCGLGGGARAAILLPPHWQTAAILLGAWSAGLTVSFWGAATSGLAATGRGVEEPFDVVFAAPDRVRSWLDRVPEAHHRFTATGSVVPEGYRDFRTEAETFGPDLAGYAPLHRTRAATVDDTTYGQWGSLGRELAEQFGLHAGDRLLVDAAEHEHAVKWLLAPLSVGASVMVVANLDRSTLDGRRTAEGITRTLL